MPCFMVHSKYRLSHCLVMAEDLGRLSGQVFTVDARPAQDAKVELVHLLQYPTGTLTAVCDAQGRFEFSDVGDGRLWLYNLRIQSSDGQQRAVYALTKNRDQASSPIVVRLQESKSICLLVTDANKPSNHEC